MTLATLLEITRTKIGNLVAELFNRTGIDQNANNPFTLDPNSLFAKIQARGNVEIVSGTMMTPQPFQWGAQLTAKTATSYGAGDNLPANVDPTYDSAALDWKRNATPVEQDNLVRLVNSAYFQGDNGPVIDDITQAVQACITKFDADLLTDGTGTGGDDVTGVKAALSASNVYAGIDQAAVALWQSNLTAAAGAALSATLMTSFIKPLADAKRLSSSHVIFAPHNQLKKFRVLYGEDQIRFVEGGGNGTFAPDMLVFHEFGISVPVQFLQGMPTTEIWCLNMAHVKIKIAAQTPINFQQIGASPNQKEFNANGLPLGVQYDASSGKDNEKLWMKLYGQCQVISPNQTAALTGLAV